MMEANFLGERASFPAVHPRGRDRDPVDRSAFDGLIAADTLET